MPLPWPWVSQAPCLFFLSDQWQLPWLLLASSALSAPCMQRTHCCAGGCCAGGGLAHVAVDVPTLGRFDNWVCMRRLGLHTVLSTSPGLSMAAQVLQGRRHGLCKGRKEDRSRRHASQGLLRLVAGHPSRTAWCSSHGRHMLLSRRAVRGHQHKQAAWLVWVSPGEYVTWICSLQGRFNSLTARVHMLWLESAPSSHSLNVWMQMCMLASSGRGKMGRMRLVTPSTAPVRAAAGSMKALQTRHSVHICRTHPWNAPPRGCSYYFATRPTYVWTTNGMKPSH